MSAFATRSRLGPTPSPRAHSRTWNRVADPDIAPAILVDAATKAACAGAVADHVPREWFELWAGEGTDSVQGKRRLMM